MSDSYMQAMITGDGSPSLAERNFARHSPAFVIEKPLTLPPKVEISVSVSKGCQVFYGVKMLALVPEMVKGLYYPIIEVERAIGVYNARGQDEIARLGTLSTAFTGILDINDIAFSASNLRLEGNFVLGDVKFLKTPKGVRLIQAWQNYIKIPHMELQRPEFRLTGTYTDVGGVVTNYEITSFHLD